MDFTDEDIKLLMVAGILAFSVIICVLAVGWFGLR